MFGAPCSKWSSGCITCSNSYQLFSFSVWYRTAKDLCLIKTSTRSNLLWPTAKAFLWKINLLQLVWRETMNALKISYRIASRCRTPCPFSRYPLSKFLQIITRICGRWYYLRWFLVIPMSIAQFRYVSVLTAPLPFSIKALLTALSIALFTSSIFESGAAQVRRNLWLSAVRQLAL